MEQASEIEAIFEAMTDGVYVYDSQGQLVRMNAAAKTFSPLFGQSEYLARPFPKRISSFPVRDQYKQPLENSNLPLTRLLRGEILTGLHTADTLLLQQNGTDILLNISGAPIWNKEDQIKGAVVVSRDVTELRNLELRTHEALEALLAMTQIIGHGFENSDGTEDETDEHHDAHRFARAFDKTAAGGLCEQWRESHGNKE